MADCTSSSATSMFSERLNCSTMTETPPELVEVIWLRPCIFAELALQRSGHGGGHHVRAGAGIEREHLDGRVVDLRQRGDRQLGEGDDADQQDGGHQQRGRDRPQNKWARRTHGASALGVGSRGQLDLGDA